MNTIMHAHSASQRPLTRLGGLAAILAILASWPVPAAGQEISSEARIRTARVTGDLPASKAFAQAAQERQPELLRCYRESLAKDPGAAGLLALIVKVEPTGKPAEITVQPSRLPAELVECAKKAITSWRIAAWKMPHRVHAELDIVFQRSAPPAPSATIRGGVPAEVVAGTIEARLPALHKDCWKGEPPARSPIIRLVVDYDGTLQTTDLSGRIATRSVHQCLLGKLRAWIFPPPDNGYRTWVYYPLFPAKRPGAAGAPREAPAPRETR
ncbi:MAG: hypothetical protein RBU30_12575 [Polyangia bacterium]|jgi:hypothetical protein|nr:hypothetical protein [Polyangia bacterium]